MTIEWTAVAGIASAIGSLTVAGIAILEIRKARETIAQSEKHHREIIEEREHERRLYKREYLLTKIIDWANDIAKCEMEEKFPDPPNEYPGLDNEQKNTQLKEKMIGMHTRIGLRYSSFQANIRYFKAISASLDSELEKLVSDLEQKLVIQVEASRKKVSGQITEVEYAEYTGALIATAWKISDRATTLVLEAAI